MEEYEKKHDHAVAEKETDIPKLTDLLLSKRLNFRHGYKNPRPHFCNRSTLIIHI